MAGLGVQDHWLREVHQSPSPSPSRSIDRRAQQAPEIRFPDPEGSIRTHWVTDGPALRTGRTPKMEKMVEIQSESLRNSLNPLRLLRRNLQQSQKTHFPCCDPPGLVTGCAQIAGLGGVDG